MSVARCQLELSAEAPPAPELEPVGCGCVDLRGRPDGVVACPAVAAAGDAVQGSELSAQRGHRGVRSGCEGQVLEHDPGLALIAAGAEGTRHAHRAGLLDFAQTLRLGFEHRKRSRGIELDEEVARRTLQAIAAIDAATTDCACAVVGKARADGGADRRGYCI